MTFRAFVIAAIALLSGACGHVDRRPYANSDPRLLANYSAKELCSCAFVMGQTDEFCERWARASPNLKSYHIYRDQGLVSTRAVFFWTARARYQGPRAGCVLESTESTASK